MQIDIPTMPENEAEFTRLFNGLDGGELRAMILAKLKTSLDKDTRFSANITHKVVSWVIKLDVVSQPREEDLTHFEQRNAIAEVDPDTGAWNFVREGQNQWPACMYIPIEIASGVQDTPDAIRQELGEPERIARQRKGFPIDEGAGFIREVSEAEVAGQEAIDRIHANDVTARRKLIEAQKARPHKMVEDSPLATGGNAFTERVDREDRTPQDARSARQNIEGAIPMVKGNADSRLGRENRSAQQVVAERTAEVIAARNAENNTGALDIDLSQAANVTEVSKEKMAEIAAKVDKKADAAEAPTNVAPKKATTKKVGRPKKAVA